MRKLLACDLDGTLFYPRKVKKCISKKNIKFLQKWYDAGNKIVLVTSRSANFTEKLKGEIERPFDVINCTSSQIYHDGNLIRNVSIPNKKLKTILDKIDEKYKPLGLLMTTKNYPVVIKNLNRAGKFLFLLVRIWNFFQFSYREKSVIDNNIFDQEILNGEIHKVILFFGFGKKKSFLAKEINKELRENFPEIESSWTMYVNELTPKNCNKGFGLKYYCEHIGFHKDDVYVVGDSGNDIQMFNEFHEHSYCMAHAYPSVKKYAKHVITRVHKLGKLVLKGENNK